MAYLGLETIRRGTSADCIRDIFTLHFPTAKKVLDATYGSGRFWGWDHYLDIVGVDCDPPVPCTVKADYRKLPFANSSCDVLVFDPPFIFSRGIQRVIGTKRFFRGAEHVEPEERTYANMPIQKAKNPRALLVHYQSLFAQRHIATQGMIVKGQDLVTSVRRDWWSFHIYNLAMEMGMGEPADILLQYSRASRMKDPRWKQQRMFRAAHCSYIVWKW